MKTIVVNAVGEQCPIPVVKATRALRGMTEPGILEVHVDNEIAVQNLTRMAAGHKLAAKSEKVAEKEFVVTMEVTQPLGEAPVEEPPMSCAPDARGNLVIAVDSAVMGHGSDELGDTLSKAEQVDIYDGNFELVRSLTPGEEMDAFFDALELGDWDVDDEEPEEHYPAEASFVFSQRPTETILGGKPAEDERQEIVRLTIYEGSDVAYLKLLLFSIHMRLPEETLSALREMALPAE